MLLPFHFCGSSDATNCCIIINPIDCSINVNKIVLFINDWETILNNADSNSNTTNNINGKEGTVKEANNNVKPSLLTNLSVTINSIRIIIPIMPNHYSNISQIVDCECIIIKIDSMCGGMNNSNYYNNIYELLGSIKDIQITTGNYKTEKSSISNLLPFEINIRQQYNFDVAYCIKGNIYIIDNNMS